MSIREDFPHPTEHLRHVEIPLRDGTRLAARIWRPESAARRPVPAILEYIPYRKNDRTAQRDSLMHPYFAGHGYASVRVDLRGSGDSEGVLTDEYTQQELDDGVEVLEWLAAQDWCSGKVGMIGISWGGFNGLQIAAMQPPELGAVVTVCSTDDRYADDVHYMGGCLLGDNISWAEQMFAYNAMPPDPANVGERWRDMWLQRLEANEPWLITWLEHQHRDAYWKHGSICEDWSKVTTPVMAVSGWADGYSNSVFRLMKNLPGPRMGLVGPWSHKYPHIGVPGPAIGFLQECLRWWDRWLKDIDTGIEAEPMLRAWMQDSVPPTPRYDHRPGRWVGEAQWPSKRIEPQTWRLAPGGRLLREADAGAPDASANLGDVPFLSVKSPLSTGVFAGKWCSYSATPDLPSDQRQEDGGALVFDSDRLENAVEILGAAEIELEYEVDKPIGMVAIRLSDVDEDDRVTRITYAVRNLCHDGGHEHPHPIEPGERRRTHIKLNDIAQRFAAGHRIRIAISTSYFPLTWPAPEHAKLRVFTENCHLTLPTRPPDPKDRDITFEEVETADPHRVTQLGIPNHNWTVLYDLARGQHTLTVTDDNGMVQMDDADLLHSDCTVEEYSAKADDYGSARAQTRTRRVLRRSDWECTTQTRMLLTSDTEHFFLRAELDAWEGEVRVFSRNWDRKIRRRCV